MPENATVVGGPVVDERCEQAEGFPSDTSRYGNFPFLTNLLRSLSERSGPVVVDGGHGQFNADYALSCEDMAYYLRYLEGQDTRLEQRNSLDDGLSDASAVLVSAPADPFTDAETEALKSFVADGGCVVCLGHAAASMPDDARSNLDAVLDGLGSDLRLNDDTVTDREANLNGDPRLPTTANVDDSFDLFGPVTPEQSAESPLEVVGVEPTGGERTERYEEAVTVANRTDAPLDLSGWSVEDEAGHRFEFPAGTTVPVGAELRLRTGRGTSRVDLYWDRDAPVWNDEGDTVSVYEEGGELIAEESY